MTDSFDTHDTHDTLEASPAPAFDAAPPESSPEVAQEAPAAPVPPDAESEPPTIPALAETPPASQYPPEPEQYLEGRPPPPPIPASHLVRTPDRTLDRTLAPILRPIPASRHIPRPRRSHATTTNTGHIRSHCMGS
jgi:hypothetical protein